jgi:putative radical SAM enzyme (TIGR03279 family)
MTYPTEAPAEGIGGRVAAVDKHGAAARCGLHVGDAIVSTEGQRLRDVIDWMWIADGTDVDVCVTDSDGTPREFTLLRHPDEGWGFEFEGVVFDGIRECDNACAFCFVGQLPPGLRPSLYVRDDDYRLSFLAGNFVTLTNLDDSDIERIIEQRLSPLHVSIHAVDPAVRARLICPTVEDRALQHIATLLAAGITLHTQVVLVPGVNDEDVLDRTLAWLAERPGIASVGVVPVGLTRYARSGAAGYHDAAAAATVLARLSPWQERMRCERGETWVQAADEFYLTGRVPLPNWDDYDGFPQFENGIGMTRAFLDEMAELIADFGEAAPHACGVVLVTGELFAPVLEALANTLSEGGCLVRVLAVRNELFGGGVTVAGLLAGADIESAILADARARAVDGRKDTYLLPASVVNDDGLTLDGYDLIRIEEGSGSDVRLVSCDAAGLVTALLELSSPVNG